MGISARNKSSLDSVQRFGCQEFEIRGPEVYFTTGRALNQPIVYIIIKAKRILERQLGRQGFFDANIYFSAARSALGGSSLVIKLSKRGKLKPFVMREVLRGTERNLRLKENVKALVRYYKNLKLTRPKIIKVNKNRAKKKLSKVINEKDTLVLPDCPLNPIPDRP